VLADDNIKVGVMEALSSGVPGSINAATKTEFTALVVASRSCIGDMIPSRDVKWSAILRIVVS